MAPPLGFRRATRKRLKRCEHPTLLGCRDVATPDTIFECEECGSMLRVDVRFPLPLDANVRNLMPPRILRPTKPQEWFTWAQDGDLQPTMVKLPSPPANP